MFNKSMLLIMFFVLIDFVQATEIGLPVSVNQAIDQGDKFFLSIPMRKESLHILASKGFGGSIVSMVYRDQQYVNDHNNNEIVDYGRQIQSAATYDDMGECFNPTEAGGRYDVGKPHSSSSLLNASVSDGHLHTVTDMAFWMRPGSRHAVYGCGGKWDGNTAQNHTVTAGYLLTKDISLFKKDSSELLRYQVEFKSPDEHQSARFVPVSIHVPDVFKVAYQRSDSGELELLKETSGRFKRPLVLSTTDGQHAIGLCLPAASESNQTMGYGLKIWPNTAVIRVFIMQRQLSSKVIKFNSYIALGNLTEVEQGLNACMSLSNK